jgi:Spy/CpxP family protein refolding chaperone
MPLVHGALGTLIWVVLIVAAVIALAAMASSGKVWDDYGKDHLLMDRDVTPGSRSGPVAALHERDEEIRQMLEARNARRVRRGEEPVDVEQELRRLTAKPQIDPELREEIRDLVQARNYRRARAGKPPLDVEAEVEREISRLGDVG